MSAPNFSLLVSRFLESKQWPRALETAGEWLAAEPESVQAHRAAAQALINLQRPAEAERHLARVLASAPGDAFAHRLMSMVHFAGGRFQAADEAIRKAIELQPNDALHWYQVSHMSFQQGDLALARTYAEQAQRLDPRNPHILNMLGLCEPREGNREEPRELQRYLQALELDPENAVLHNNVGACHLNGGRDFAAAEACSRRALMLEPTNPLFRRNLLLTIKHRDRFYRLLCLPRDFLAKVAGKMRRTRRQSFILYLLLIPLWLVALRFMIAALLLWCLLVWPMLKVYEHLTIGDLRREAGEIGAQRGGWLGYRAWPRWVRMSLFTVALLAFWGGVAFGVHERNRLVLRVVSVGIIMAVVVILFRILRKWYREARSRLHTRRRKRALRTLIET
jgi:Flp pilus assembly protein TadD